MSAAVDTVRVMVRPMREADLGAVALIEGEAYEFPWSEGIFRDCLRAGYCCWLLEQGADTQAYGIVQVGGGEAHVLNLCVRPESQRRGHGRTLLLRLMEVAHGHRAASALLEVRPSNHAAIALYASLGFSEVGMRRAYYPGHGGREDAIILARSLPA